jgi:transcriptional antiterminator RfaH
MVQAENLINKKVNAVCGKHLGEKRENSHFWYVIYTKSRNEKKVASLLKKYNIETYCPVKISERQWSDRKKKTETPLFSSYCFVRLTPNNLKDVFKIPGVVRYVYWCGKPAIVHNFEIEEIKRWLSDYDHSSIQIQSIGIYDVVEIKSGPFIDSFAKIVAKNGNQILLELKGLGLKLSVNNNQIILNKVV